jgi:MurNAc alpha-1-phosphate uridylyltransferase
LNLHAMILAAGRGERMRPLTDTCPKPLLPVGGKPLIVWQIERLARAGFENIVINHAHLGQMIEDALGDGSRWGVRIRYSAEGQALETAGGIALALPLLGTDPFVVTSGDVYSDYPYEALRPVVDSLQSGSRVAHFVLVDNPPFHPRGDMALDAGTVGMEGTRLNYAGISVFRPELFAGLLPGTKKSLFPWMYDLVRAGQVSGEHYRGKWVNLGTPNQLAELDAALGQGGGERGSIR